MKTKECRKCGALITKYSITEYCAACVGTAKLCNSCDRPIAAYNRSGMCLLCQRPKKSGQ